MHTSKEFEAFTLIREYPPTTSTLNLLALPVRKQLLLFLAQMVISTLTSSLHHLKASLHQTPASSSPVCLTMHKYIHTVHPHMSLVKSLPNDSPSSSLQWLDPFRLERWPPATPATPATTALVLLRQLFSRQSPGLLHYRPLCARWHPPPTHTELVINSTAPSSTAQPIGKTRCRGCVDVRGQAGGIH